MIDLTAKPFNLDEKQIDWVQATLAAMTDQEKIGQLFFPIGFSTEEGFLQHLLDLKIGGLFFRAGHADEVRKVYQYAQAHSKIPLLTAANLEDGGTGGIIEGTSYAPQMAVGATGDAKYARKLGEVAAKDAKSVGINWGFSPVVDLDLNFHSPIINVRSYGDNAERVIAYAKQYISAFDDENLLTSIKHFPGDGVDERDQHLLTSINSLSVKAWRQTYGKIYQELIDFGAKAVMVGHMAFPAYTGNLVPATLNKTLLNDLLRQELGFNGLIITDATPMVGFSTAMSRREAVPTSIQNGCDMFLFNHDLEEDIAYMTEGLASGLLTHERLDEAVSRILAMKAAIGLNEGVAIPDGPLPEFPGAQAEVADKAITLVKDEQNLLPLSDQKHKRILLEILGDFASNDRVEKRLVEQLSARGFEVTVYQPETNFFELGSVEDFKASYDLVLYAANVENASNHTVARINWKTMFGLGNNLPWFVHEVPTALISLGNPYHEFDLPMVKTVVNAYSNFEHFIDATVAKLVGESDFKGQSPVDTSCQNLKLQALLAVKDEE